MVIADGPSMKSFYRALMVVVGFAGTPLLVSCGSTTPPAAANVPGVSAASCVAGQVYSPQYGCLAQSNCPAGEGLYNNQCVLLTATSNGTTVCSAGLVSTQYGCLPQGNCPAGLGSYNGQCVYAGIPTGAGTGAPGTCTVGQVWSQYGCLSQGTCTNGYALYNGSCTAITASSGGYNGYNGYNGYGGGYAGYGGYTGYNGGYGGYPGAGYAGYTPSFNPGYSSGGYVSGGIVVGVGVGIGGGYNSGSNHNGMVLTQRGWLFQETCPCGYGYLDGFCYR